MSIAEAPAREPAMHTMPIQRPATFEEEIELPIAHTADGAHAYFPAFSVMKYAVISLI